MAAAAAVPAAAVSAQLAIAPAPAAFPSVIAAMPHGILPLPPLVPNIPVPPPPLWRLWQVGWPLLSSGYRSLKADDVAVSKESVQAGVEMARKFMAQPSPSYAAGLGMTLQDIEELVTKLLATPPPKRIARGNITGHNSAVTVDARVLVDGEKYKGAWIPNEDVCLVELVHQMGARRWSKVASRLGTGRNSKQCCKGSSARLQARRCISTFTHVRHSGIVVGVREIRSPPPHAPALTLSPTSPTP